MATMSVTASASAFARAVAVPKSPAGTASPVVGLPRIAARGGRVKCSSEAKPSAAGTGICSSALAAVSVMSVSNPVLALVDERMSTEGTGLSLGISNNLLAWILLGVFGLIWALFFVYTSTLEEDEDSGLSL